MHKIFLDIKCSPIIELLATPTGGREHVAGPHFPDFDSQTLFRHRRGNNQPIDSLPPDFNKDSAKKLDGYYLYGGCIVDHYGHFISEFIHRLIPGIHDFPNSKILFCTNGEFQKVPKFVTDLFEFFGILDRVYYLYEDSIVSNLIVYPQAEYIGSASPTAEYIDLLTSHARTKLERKDGNSKVFVSRSRQKIRFVAEEFLDYFFAQLGFLVFYPEEHTLLNQLNVYSNADVLFFSEGSALHTLQIIGKIRADVYVISRRKGAFGRNFLMPRVRSLHYLNYIYSSVAPLDAIGRRAEWCALIFLDIFSLISEIGILFDFDRRAIFLLLSNQLKLIEEFYASDLFAWFDSNKTNVIFSNETSINSIMHDLYKNEAINLSLLKRVLHSSGYLRNFDETVTLLKIENVDNFIFIFKDYNLIINRISGSDNVVYSISSVPDSISFDFDTRNLLSLNFEHGQILTNYILFCFRSNISIDQNINQNILNLKLFDDLDGVGRLNLFISKLDDLSIGVDFFSHLKRIYSEVNFLPLETPSYFMNDDSMLFNDLNNNVWSIYEHPDFSAKLNMILRSCPSASFPDVYLLISRYFKNIFRSDLSLLYAIAFYCDARNEFSLRHLCESSEDICQSIFSFSALQLYAIDPSNLSYINFKEKTICL